MPWGMTVASGSTRRNGSSWTIVAALAAADRGLHAWRCRPGRRRPARRRGAAGCRRGRPSPARRPGASWSPAGAPRRAERPSAGSRPSSDARAAVEEQLELQVDDAGRRPPGPPAWPPAARPARARRPGAPGRHRRRTRRDRRRARARRPAPAGRRRRAPWARLAVYEATPLWPPWRSPAGGYGAMSATSGCIGIDARPRRSSTGRAPASAVGTTGIVRWWIHRRSALFSIRDASRRGAELGARPGRARPSAPRRRRSRAGRATTSRSTSNRKSRDDISGTTRSTTRRWITLAPHWVSAYGRWNSRRTPQANPDDVSDRPRATGARRERRRQAPAGDDAVDVGGGDRHPGQLGRRRGAVGVDEADEVGVAAAERLHEHAALAELGELVEHDPRRRPGRGPGRSRRSGRHTRRGRRGTGRRAGGSRRGTP